MDGLIAYALAKKYADKVGQSILDAGFKVQVEQDRSILSRTGEQKILYLLPKETSLSSDTYDEYIYTNKWEQVGSTDVNIDYNQLKNKPTINQFTLANNIRLNPFIFTYDEVNLGNIIRYDLDVIRDHVFCYTDNVSNFFSLYNKEIAYLQVSQEQYEYLPVQKDGVVFRFVDDRDADTFLDYTTYYIFFPEDGNAIYLKTDVIDSDHIPYSRGSWRKVGGVRITSGVVNQNGTITFTDSDGNTFTTAGSSVIGPQGDDYVLTNQDKTDIANIVLQLLPNADVMSF